MILPDLDIQAQFNKVIEHSQCIENAKTDELFTRWRVAKSAIRNRLFKDKLIYETKEVSFELEENAKKERLQSFADWVYEIHDGDCDALTEFLDNLSTQEFYNNRLNEEYEDRVRGVKVPKGIKIIKAFKYFVSADSPNLLHDLQSRASEIIQENKVSGILCFSIHPLDFLSSSENQYHWRSCHSLDGEFRTGNLSYMCDNHTIMCYLKSKTDVKLPNFPSDVLWNNKKWRCLLFLNDFCNPSCIFAGRQYPFFSSGGLNVVREELIKLLNQMSPYSRLWSNWYNDTIRTYDFPDQNRTIFAQEFYPISQYLIGAEELIQDAEDSMHYNDLLYSSCYKPYYMFRNAYIPKPEFKIGSAVRCLRCEQNFIITKDTMMCPECELQYGNSESEDYTHCDNCGGRCLESDTYWVDNDQVCPNCAKNDTFVCAECHERHYNSDKKYDSANDRYICIHCYREEEE